MDVFDGARVSVEVAFFHQSWHTKHSSSSTKNTTLLDFRFFFFVLLNIEATLNIPDKSTENTTLVRFLTALWDIVAHKTREIYSQPKCYRSFCMSHTKHARYREPKYCRTLQVMYVFLYFYFFVSLGAVLFANPEKA